MVGRQRAGDAGGGARRLPGRPAGTARLHPRQHARLTHTDPRAERAPCSSPWRAHHGASHGPAGVDARHFLAEARTVLIGCDDALADLLRRLEASLLHGDTTAAFANELGLTRGVTGYIYHTVPVVLHAWLSSGGDFRRAMAETIRLGGDADTTGAIIGGIAGATWGAGGIPTEWLRLAEWPRSMPWMRRLAAALAEAFPGTGTARPGVPPRLFWPALWPRNLFFFLVVLAHLGRRWLPPW
ncbi:MAG: ADP-ribosylglycohydrolase family protein [Gemmataceae bacterium]